MVGSKIGVTADSTTVGSLTMDSYLARQEESGRSFSFENAKMAIREFVKNKIFRRMRFHNEKNGGLDYNGKLCKIVFDSLGWSEMKDDWKMATWIDTKPIVKEVFKRRKNACHTAIKNATMSKSVLHEHTINLTHSGIMAGEEGVNLHDILQLRKDVNGAYTIFCSEILPSGVSGNGNKKWWLNETSMHPVSEVATSLEEAFTLLELKNNWKVWEELVNWKRENPNESMDNYDGKEKPLWTVRRAGNAGGDLIEGWRAEGHTELVRLHKEVRADRISAAGRVFETKFENRQNEDDLKSRAGRKRKRMNVPAVEHVDLLDDFLLNDCTDQMLPMVPI